MDIKELTAKANQMRREMLVMLHTAGTGHPGGSLSAIDLMTVLYYRFLHIDPTNPHWEERDRFILSKGHACPALYVVLADKGFFQKEELKKLRKLGALLQGSPDVKIPGIEMPGGSLGQGLSAGVGMALGARLKRQSFRVYVLMGDGESQEGQIWEAAMSAGQFRLNNLTAIIDYNKLQGDGAVRETISLDPLADKWKSFGWNVVEVDGHDFKQISDAFKTAGDSHAKPTCIIAHTIKGKGVSFMENVPAWHGSNVPNAEELEMALNELNP